MSFVSKQVTNDKNVIHVLEDHTINTQVQFDYKLRYANSDCEKCSIY